MNPSEENDLFRVKYSAGIADALVHIASAVLYLWSMGWLYLVR